LRLRASVASELQSTATERRVRGMKPRTLLKVWFTVSPFRRLFSCVSAEGASVIVGVVLKPPSATFA